MRQSLLAGQGRHGSRPPGCLWSGPLTGGEAQALRREDSGSWGKAGRLCDWPAGDS